MLMFRMIGLPSIRMSQTMEVASPEHVMRITGGGRLVNSTAPRAAGEPRLQHPGLRR
jgi:hypothetical protein